MIKFYISIKIATIGPIAYIGLFFERGCVNNNILEIMYYCHRRGCLKNIFLHRKIFRGGVRPFNLLLLPSDYVCGIDWHKYDTHFTKQLSDIKKQSCIVLFDFELGGYHID